MTNVTVNTSNAVLYADVTFASTNQPWVNCNPIRDSGGNKMKTKAYSIVIVLALLIYWLGLCNASAFYDPGAQRWLNRDPICEGVTERLPHNYKLSTAEDSNRFLFAANNPIQWIDLFGLKTDAPGLLDKAGEWIEKHGGWDAVKAGVDFGGEMTSLFQIFGDSCKTLGLVMAYTQTQQKNCMLEAFKCELSGNAAKGAQMEKDCAANWGAKNTALLSIFDAKCKGTK